MANWTQIGAGVAAGGGGTGGDPLPGLVTSPTAQIIERFEIDGVKKIKVGINYTSPGGVFAGVYVYPEIPDGSGVPRSPITVAFTVGVSALSNEFRVQEPTYCPYDPTSLYAAIVVVDAQDAMARFWLVSVSDKATSPGIEWGVTPSVTLLLTLNPSGDGAYGEEYGPRCTNLTAHSDLADIGGVRQTRVFVEFTPAGDPINKYHVHVVYRDDNGIEQHNVGLVLGGSASTPSNWFPAPKIQNARVYVLSASDPAGTSDPSDDGVNSYSSGFTPEVVIAIGTNDGSVDLTYSFNYNTSEFEIAPDGKWSVKGVDLSKSFSFDTAEFEVAPNGQWSMKGVDFSKGFNYNTTDFQIVTGVGLQVKNVDFTKAINFDDALFVVSAGEFKILTDGITETYIGPNSVSTPKLQAGAVTTAKLTTSQIDIGGGGGKPIRLRVYDASNNPIGWIGDDTAVTGYVGAWFKRLLVGGDNPSAAGFFADISGNVVAKTVLVNDATGSYGWIGAKDGYVGAWFPRLLVGGASPAGAGLFADSSGNVVASSLLVTEESGSSGWIGARGGYVGAWFPRMFVGGTGPADAPLFADSLGRVVMSGVYVYDGGSPLGWIGESGTDTGAWFKKVSIGGTSFATAPLKADSSGNVTLVNGSLSFTGTGFGIDINNTEGIRVTGNSIITRIRPTDSRGGTYAGMEVLNTSLTRFARIAPSLIQLMDENYTYVRIGVSVSPEEGYMSIYDSSGNQMVDLGSSGVSLYGTSPDLTINGIKIVGARQNAVTMPTGGSVVDVEARAAINTLYQRLQSHGLVY